MDLKDFKFKNKNIDGSKGSIGVQWYKFRITKALKFIKNFGSKFIDEYLNFFKKIWIDLKGY